MWGETENKWSGLRCMIFILLGSIPDELAVFKFSEILIVLMCLNSVNQPDSETVHQDLKYHMMHM